MESSHRDVSHWWLRKGVDTKRVAYARLAIPGCALCLLLTAFVIPASAQPVIITTTENRKLGIEN